MNIDPTYIVGVLIVGVYTLIETIKHKESKKNGKGLSCLLAPPGFTAGDQRKLSTLHDQHSHTDVAGRPVWYGNTKELEEQSKKLDKTLELQRGMLTELKTMNLTLGMWTCPYNGNE